MVNSKLSLTSESNISYSRVTSEKDDDDPFDVNKKKLKRYSLSYGITLHELKTPADRWPNHPISFTATAIKGNKGFRPLPNGQGGWHLYSAKIGSAATGIRPSSNALHPIHATIENIGKHHFLGNVSDAVDTGTFILVQGRSWRSEYPLEQLSEFIVNGTRFKVMSLVIKSECETLEVNPSGRERKIRFGESSHRVKYRKINDEDIEWPDEGILRTKKSPRRFGRVK